MSEPGCCIHQYRRDAESCPYCELIEAEEAAETYHAAWQDAAVYWKADRDALREQAARLEEERSDFRDRATYMEKAFSNCSRHLTELHSECQRLRAALRQYGAHDVTCRFDGITCRCGFSEALGEKEGAG